MPGTVDNHWLIGQSTCLSAFKDYFSKEKARNLCGSRPFHISSTRQATASSSRLCLFCCKFHPPLVAFIHNRNRFLQGDRNEASGGLRYRPRPDHLHTTSFLTPGETNDLGSLFLSQWGSTDAIVRGLDKAQSTVLVQAYSFTSNKIAMVLLNAHKRGIEVAVILDKSQKSDQYSPKRSSWRWWRL